MPKTKKSYDVASVSEAHEISGQMVLNKTKNVNANNLKIGYWVLTGIALMHADPVGGVRRLLKAAEVGFARHRKLTRSINILRQGLRLLSWTDYIMDEAEESVIEFIMDR